MKESRKHSILDFHLFNSFFFYTVYSKNSSFNWLASVAGQLPQKTDVKLGKTLNKDSM